MKLVKSPLNYTGGKFKLLPQLLELFPKDIDTFVDLFAGGGNVGANVKANRVMFNDISEKVIDLLQSFSLSDPSYHFFHIDKIIKMYKLDRGSTTGYYLLRNDYNNRFRESSYMLFVLICHSFNNQIRFNKNGEFNVPFGQRTFNEKMRQNFIEFVERLNSLECYFFSRSFEEIIWELGLDEDDFVYCDPPYLITTATYNENGGWTETHEKTLIETLDKLNEKGVRFALSNVLDHKGKENTILKEWSKKYRVHYLDHDYNNSSYQSKNIDQKTTEVLITNY